MRALERYLLLQIIDQRWREHLYDMDYLREGIHLRGFAQIDPLVAYKNEAFTLFQDLMNSIWSDFARMVYNVEVQVEGENGDGGGGDPAPQRRRRAPAGVGGARVLRRRRRPTSRRAYGGEPLRAADARRGSPSRPRRSRSASSTRPSSSAATTRAGAGRARSSRSATGPERAEPPVGAGREAARMRPQRLDGRGQLVAAPLSTCAASSSSPRPLVEGQQAAGDLGAREPFGAPSSVSRTRRPRAPRATSADRVQDPQARPSGRAWMSSSAEPRGIGRARADDRRHGRLYGASRGDGGMPARAPPASRRRAGSASRRRDRRVAAAIGDGARPRRIAAPGWASGWPSAGTSVTPCAVGGELDEQRDVVGAVADVGLEAGGPARAQRAGRRTASPRGSRTRRSLGQAAQRRPAGRPRAAGWSRGRASTIAVARRGRRARAPRSCGRGAGAVLLGHHDVDVAGAQERQRLLGLHLEQLEPQARRGGRPAGASPARRASAPRSGRRRPARGPWTAPESAASSASAALEPREHRRRCARRAGARRR